MTTEAQAQAAVEEFRGKLEAKFASDERFRSVSRLDREDGSTLATHFQVADSLWLEIAVRPGIPQVRVGIVTDDRWKNEDLEDAIEETGDTMSEFVELGFDEAGLEWPNPPVEHYRDQGKYFCFTTAFEPDGLDALRDAGTLQKTTRMFEGYYEAFRGAIEKAAAAQ